MCNEGDVVIAENPSFIGALNAFRSNGARLVGVEMENDGMNIAELENALKANPKAKFIYIIPTPPFYYTIIPYKANIFKM